MNLTNNNFDVKVSIISFAHYFQNWFFSYSINSINNINPIYVALRKAFHFWIGYKLNKTLGGTIVFKGVASFLDLQTRTSTMLKGCSKRAIVIKQLLWTLKKTVIFKEKLTENTPKQSKDRVNIFWNWYINFPRI